MLPNLPLCPMATRTAVQSLRSETSTTGTRRVTPWPVGQLDWSISINLGLSTRLTTAT
jgi:hypothetical protein